MSAKKTDNPLLSALRELLCEPGDCYTEHALIKVLVARGLIAENFNDGPQRLFQTHFLLFNGLYSLKRELASQRLGLDIGLVDVRVYAMASPSTDSVAVETSREARLSEYYLNWQHFEAATNASVSELLDNFWRQFGRVSSTSGDRLRALEILQLEEPVDYGQIKQRYRRLAMQVHPDRGGDTEQLQDINWAMSVLQPRGQNL
ncbi:DNA-J related domain-containing protein [Gilvimarinus chinensis]|uniref:DNA-J related domain-containing protein n=1 Tax=Gilvimarinus chinensis TaxID=396005 RepID=UPI0003641034|nr:DNA-J related domain-containing protein [Gilvimarinus chinensis]